MSGDPYRTAEQMFEIPRRRPILPRLKLALAYVVLFVVVEAVGTAFFCGMAQVQTKREALALTCFIHALIGIIAAVAWAVKTIAKAKDEAAR